MNRVSKLKHLAPWITMMSVRQDFRHSRQINAFLVHRRVVWRLHLWPNRLFIPISYVQSTIPLIINMRMRNLKMPLHMYQTWYDLIEEKRCSCKDWRKINKGMHHLPANRAPRNRHADKIISMVYAKSPPSLSLFSAIVVDRKSFENRQQFATYITFK